MKIKINAIIGGLLVANLTMTPVYAYDCVAEYGNSLETVSCVLCQSECEFKCVLASDERGFDSSTCFDNEGIFSCTPFLSLLCPMSERISTTTL